MVDQEVLYSGNDDGNINDRQMRADTSVSSEFSLISDSYLAVNNRPDVRQGNRIRRDGFGRERSASFESEKKMPKTKIQISIEGLTSIENRQQPPFGIFNWTFDIHHNCIQKRCQMRLPRDMRVYSFRPIPFKGEVI